MKAVLKDLITIEEFKEMQPHTLFDMHDYETMGICDLTWQNLSDIAGILMNKEYGEDYRPKGYWAQISIEILVNRSFRAEKYIF